MSPASFGRPDGSTDGFVLLEIICTIAILALLYAIVLPAFPQRTSRVRLEGYALQTASVLKADRNAAIRQQVPVATTVDIRERIIRSGATGQLVALPTDVAIDGLLAARCANRPNGPAIRFFATGMSCGGTIALTRNGVGYEVRVNWLTGSVEIAPFAENAQ
jgi:general secretion pathway protein H